MRKHKTGSIFGAVISVTLLLLLSLTSVRAQKPSTPEELAKLVEIARLLESDPLAKSSKAARQWYTDWIRNTRVPSIPACSAFFESEDKNKYLDELSLQFKISTAAFMVEHSDQSQDPAARLLAGVAGMLKVYEKVLLANPQSHSAFLDSLIVLQHNNELSKNVGRIMARCSDVPLSDTNKSLSTGEVVYAPIEVEVLPYVPRPPYPQYPPQARSNHTQGKVILYVVFDQTGNIADIEVIQGLRDGLTENSLKSARTLNIQPSLIAGKPVATKVKLEYQFMVGN